MSTRPTYRYLLVFGLAAILGVFGGFSRTGPPSLAPRVVHAQGAQCYPSCCYTLSVVPTVPENCHAPAGYNVTMSGSTCGAGVGRWNFRVVCADGTYVTREKNINQSTYSEPFSCVCKNSTVSLARIDVGNGDQRKLNTLNVAVTCCATMTPTPPATDVPPTDVPPTEVPPATAVPTLTAVPTPLPTEDCPLDTSVATTITELDPDYNDLGLCLAEGLYSWPMIKAGHDGNPPAKSTRFLSIGTGDDHGWVVKLILKYRKDCTGETVTHTCDVNPLNGQLTNCQNSAGHSTAPIVNFTAASTAEQPSCNQSNIEHRHEGYQMSLTYRRGYVENGNWSIVQDPNDEAQKFPRYTVDVGASLGPVGGIRDVRSMECSPLLPCHPGILTSCRFPQPGDTADARYCVFYFHQAQ